MDLSTRKFSLILVPLLFAVLLGACHDHEAGAYGIFEVELIDRADDSRIADVHGDHWHGQIVVEEGGEHLSVGFRFLDEDEDQIDIDLGGDITYEVRDFDDSIVAVDTHSDHFHVHGLQVGDTITTFSLMEDGETIYEFGEGSPVTVIVTESE